MITVVIFPTVWQRRVSGDGDHERRCQGDHDERENQAGSDNAINVDVKPIGKHRVWVPSNNTLGSHIGGHWVEVEDGAKPEPGLLNVNKANAEQFQRQSERIESASGR
jgi:hypothetical protein